MVQPGAPGAASRVLSAPPNTAALPVTADDIVFMRGMIHHHRQAVEMVGLIDQRTADPTIRRTGERISGAQAGEIGFMEDWLAAHVQDDGGGEHAAHMGAAMPGMLTPDQMTALAAARGPAFDRLFLSGMIQHHQGALAMVKALTAQPGAGHEPNLSQFLNSVYADQTSEIGRMQRLLRAGA